MIGAWCNRDLAVDLGTATTRVSALRHGRLVEGPSASALQHGVIVNPEAAAGVLEGLFARLRRLGLLRPRVLVCLPTDVTPGERAAVVAAARAAGAVAVAMVPEPLAAAVGAGLDVSSPYAQLVIDIGHGVSDCAVIRQGEVIASSAVRIACADLHSAASVLAARRTGLQLLPGEAERLVRQVGVAPLVGAAPALKVTGRFARERVSALVEVREVAEVLEPVVARMLGGVTALLRDLPGRAGAEIIESGLLVTGGGALLSGVCDRLAAATGMAVRRAADPLRAVIRGAREILPTVVQHDLWQHGTVSRHGV
jgi:rod shape-determining protein MreB